MWRLRWEPVKIPPDLESNGAPHLALPAYLVYHTRRECEDRDCAASGPGWTTPGLGVAVLRPGRRGRSIPRDHARDRAHGAHAPTDGRGAGQDGRFDRGGG